MIGASVEALLVFGVGIVASLVTAYAVVCIAAANGRDHGSPRLGTALFMRRRRLAPYVPSAPRRSFALSDPQRCKQEATDDEAPQRAA